MSIAIISEDFAGMRAQAEGLVSRLSATSHFYPVRMRGLWRKLPTRLCLNPLKAADTIRLAPDTQWLLSVGGTGAAIGAALRRKTGLRLVQIQNPRMSLDKFDLVIANYHDRISGPNVVQTRTALHGVTQNRLAKAREAWSERLRPADKPLLSVLLGGSNGRFRLGREEGRDIGRSLMQIARKHNMTLAITPSRRTNQQALDALKAEVIETQPFIWNGEGDNPYLGMLACADMIAVTTDSVSMISEAVATHAAVQIITLPGRSRRLTTFVKGLEALDRVRPLQQGCSHWEVSPLDDTEIAVDEVKKRLLG